MSGQIIIEKRNSLSLEENARAKIEKIDIDGMISDHEKHIWRQGLIPDVFHSEIMLNVLREKNIEQYEKIKSIVDNVSSKAYDNIIRQINMNHVLSVRDVKSLNKDSLNTLFANHKNLRHKVRLYNFILNDNFSQSHLEIALRYMGISSFIMFRLPEIPMKLSYLNKVNRPTIRLLEIIARAMSSWGRIIRTSSGMAKVKVEKDISDDEIKIIYFPMMLTNENLYRNCLVAMGMLCPICSGIGVVPHTRKYNGKLLIKGSECSECKS